jgi:D-alanine transfer protein
VRFLSQHIIPLLIACLVGYTVLELTVNTAKIQPKINRINIQKTTENYFPNLGTKPSKFGALTTSLDNKSGITFLGSSELTTDSPNIPYRFINEKTAYSLKAFGHAYYQSFAIHCQLMAFREHLRGSNICIIVSPGWFEGEGTNIQAFLEYVRPEMLGNIAWDNQILSADKEQIGEYIQRNQENIDGLPVEMEYFELLSSDYAFLKTYRLNALRKKIAVNRYRSVSHVPLCKPKKFKPNWSELAQKCQYDFLSTANKRYLIEQHIFEKVSKGKTTLETIPYNPTALEDNQELKDFNSLLKFLKREGVHASIVIQGLNPHVYTNLEAFEPFIKAIKKSCKQQQFPVLDLFVSKKNAYRPGMLNDSMHMGEYGWIFVNQFLIATYYEK